MRATAYGLAAMAAAVLSWTAAVRAEDGYGDLVGEFVLEGEIPKPTLFHKAGAATVKDAAICAAEDTYDNEVVVDPESKGIANIFVYMTSVEFKKIKDKMHPDLAASKEKELVLDQKGCMFFPHVMLVRLDQTVRVKSMDATAHNTHSSPISNDPENFTIAANDRKGNTFQKFEKAERVPIPVKCDIHGWMVSHWLILDHPYAAVTDKKGKFTIPKLPAGEHTLRLWHERQGYIKFVKPGEVFVGETDPNIKTTDLKVKIESGKSTDVGKIKIPVAKLAKKAS
ncbi:MAG: hypothetical protein IT428_01950 [Planctomycetaceae bacterium]|nr:hypothetical protein [Planctomycetaceae bacterium]